jgi:hypothetical protein
MQDLLVGPVGSLEDLSDLDFHFGGGAGGLGDELDQVAGILEESLDTGDVGKIVLAAFRRDGEIASLLDEVTGALDTFEGGNETGHGISFEYIILINMEQWELLGVRSNSGKICLEGINALNSLSI